MQLSYRKYYPALAVGLPEKQAVVNFLYTHLDEYGDQAKDIAKCADYALSGGTHPGGVIISAWDGETIVGATIINKTGMAGFIPENILVYIAIHNEYRGKGIGKELMQQAFDATNGDIALHVEADNPAKFLYDKLGFTNKYLEMRWKRPS